MPPKQIKQEKCGVCAKSVAKDDQAVQCEICNIWFHAKCQDMSIDLYNAINQFSADIHWFCKSCKGGAEKLLSIMSQLQLKVDRLEETIDKSHTEAMSCIAQVDTELKQEVNSVKLMCKSLEEKIISNQDAFHQELNQLKGLPHNGTTDWEAPTSWSGIVAKEVDNKLKQMSNDVRAVQITMAEQHERLLRDKNIILYNVPENRVDDKEQWYKNEMSIVLALFNDALKAQVNPLEIQKTVRLGKRSDIDRSRPLLVSLASKATKNLIMESARYLRHATSPFDKIIISHDMTKIEREECKRLVDEAKKLQAAEQGEWNYRVRGIPSQMKILKLRRHQ